MQFGPSLDKRKIQGLVEGTGWNNFIELNRMAFADWLPRNSESRAISVALRLIKKNYPNIEWVISFADATQCGDGTIYRASGFVLTGIKENNQIWAAPSGEKFSRMSLTDGRSKQEQGKALLVASRTTLTKGKHICHAMQMRAAGSPGRTGEISKITGGGASMKGFVAAGWEPLKGFQLRYIYFLTPSARSRLTVPVIPFSEIAKRGASMYKGKSILRGESIVDDVPGFQSGEGGSTPTSPLQI